MDVLIGSKDPDVGKEVERSREIDGEGCNIDSENNLVPSTIILACVDLHHRPLYV